MAAMQQGQAPAQAAARPEPTEEQIALAWRQMRNRNACPATLEATLAHPVWSRALHGLAVNLSRRNPAGPSTAAVLECDHCGPVDDHAGSCPSGSTTCPVWPRHGASLGQEAASRLGAGTYVPPNPTAPVRVAYPRLAGTDRKRLAANDRD